MTPAARTPRGATWLLNRLLSGPRRDAVIGDLIEQYHRGRSRWWYWQQTLGAVIADASGGIREHKLLAMRAAILGFSVVWFVGELISPISIWSRVWLWNWTIEHSLDSVREIAFGRFAFTMVSLTPCLYWLIAGSVVARTHRPHSMAMVFAFIIAHQLTYLGQMLWFYGVPGFTTELAPTLRELTINVAWMAASTVSLLLGGLMAGDDERYGMRPSVSSM